MNINILQTVKNFFKQAFGTKEKTQHEEVAIGVKSFWAFRFNSSASGHSYSKLVRADRTGSPSFVQSALVGTLKPQVGKRQRIKHRARTNAAKNR